MDRTIDSNKDFEYFSEFYVYFFENLSNSSEKITITMVAVFYGIQDQAYGFKKLQYPIMI